MNNPLVSVIMPVYNGEKTLYLTLKSLLKQTYTNWECIIINDGSTDGTPKYLEKLEDSRFKVFHLKQNKGRGYARQEALIKATGKYIAYLDADDWYDPDKLYKQVLFLENHEDVSLVSCGILSYGIKCGITRVRGKGNNSIQSFSIDNCSIMCAASMIRREATEGINYNITLNSGEDIDFFSRCLKGRKYSALDEVLYYYSEFDSMSLRKMQKSSKDNFLREKNIKNLFRLIFYYFVAPLIGMNAVISMRGEKTTIKERRKYEQLMRELVSVQF